MDERCREALKQMNLPHLIDKFSEHNMDYDGLLLLKEFPDTISNIVSNLKDGLLLRKGLQTLDEVCSGSFGSEVMETNSSSSSQSKELSIISTSLFTETSLSDICSEQGQSQEIIIASPETSHYKRIRVDSERIEDILQENNQLPEKNYIQELLERTAAGKAILSLHREKGLDNNSRCKLAEIIIHAEYGADTNTVISRIRFLELANLIAQCFSNEYQEAYYIPSCVRGKGHSASGKLYDAYTNFNKTLREAKLRNCFPFVPTSSSSPSSCSALQLSSLHPGSQEEFAVQRKLQFLMTHVEPWAEVKSCWQSTSLYRQNNLRECSGDTVAEYFEKFPALKQPGGHLLLEIDFAVLFSEAQNNWDIKWPAFSEKVKAELVKIGIKEDSLDCDAALLYALPKLFGIVPVKVPGKKPWRASRAEIQEGFLVHLKVIDDLQKILEGMRKSVQLRGTQLQPFALIVGDCLKNINSSYIIIDDRPILVESPARAVEVVFKAYHALNCQYPVQSARIWIVLAKVLYKIEEDWDKGIVTTAEIQRLIKILQC